MTDADILAFSPLEERGPHGASAGRPSSTSDDRLAPAPPRRLWPWMLLALAALLVLTAAGAALALVSLAQEALDNVDIVVNGRHIGGWPLGDESFGAVVAGVTIALLALMVAVPVALALAGVALALATGATLLFSAAAAALALAPLVLVAWLLWLAVRAGRRTAAAPA